MRKVIVLATVGILGAAAVVVADNCRDLLLGKSYSCNGLTDSNEAFTMKLDFGTVELGSLFMQVNDGPVGRCTCKAKKTSVSKPDRIGFGDSKSFHCLTQAGTDFSGEFSGPETFLVDRASFEGTPSNKGAIKKGQASDVAGNAIVYECALSGAEQQ